MSESKTHKAGFVNIIGKPNVGKSTLMNTMMGEKLSIITSKAQTTRHRIMGLLNGEDFQIIYSDTPGILKPKYRLQESMMGFVNNALQDADMLLLVVALGEEWEAEELASIKGKVNCPIIVILNKIDLAKDQKEVNVQISKLSKQINALVVLPVSATEGFNVQQVFDKILEILPTHPAYYPKDEITDKPERFFVAEIIREKIFMNYKQEIPYSSEVVIQSFKESQNIIKIYAEIYVERSTQKGILIGKQGSSLKKVGIQARQDIERFFQKKVSLVTYVRVIEGWRKKKNILRKFGYE